VDKHGSRTRYRQRKQAAGRTDADREPTDGGDTIQFGGLPIRWPFGEADPLRRVLPYLTDRVGAARRAVVIATLIALIVGLLVGFSVGHFTAHASRKVAAPPTTSTRISLTPILNPLWATAAIETTGQECAAQAGKNLLLGVEIENTSGSTIALARVIPEFPMGGLHTIAIGIGVCGELPTVFPITSLSAGSTEWITATVAVRVKCPEPYPVWFKVEYSRAGKSEGTVIQAFPDLGEVSYGNCAANKLEAVETP
jgi:hypothetical protein